jgi:hypothetical protein
MTLDEARHRIEREKGALPSPGRILATASRERIDTQTYDRELPDRVRTTLY